MRSRRLRLITKLDKVFSEFIRRRDKFTCITCGKVGTLKTMQNGHYLRRGIMQFRFHEKNCHCQCAVCNVFREGEKDIYRKKMIELYGKEFIELIEAERHKTCKISTGEIEVLISHYKSEVKKLEHSGLV